MRYWVLLPLVILASGCVTPDSTDRSIARQVKYIESLQKVHEAATDKLAEVGEDLTRARQELEVLRIQRAQDQIIEESGQ